MKFTEIQNILQKLEIFSITDLKNIDTHFDKKKLYLWNKKGYIKNICRGYYIIGNKQIDEVFSYKIANTIYNPSYISLEKALSYYHIIPEAIFGITNITSKKTKEIQINNTLYMYKNLKKELFFGYKIEKIGKQTFFVAEMEKALLDFLYFKKNIQDREDILGLRLHFDILKKELDIKKLKKYAKIFNKKVVDNKVQILLNLIEQG